MKTYINTMDIFFQQNFGTRRYIDDQLVQSAAYRQTY